MKKIILLTMLLLSVFAVRQGYAQTCGCTNCPLNLPDNGSQDFFVNVSGADNNDLATNNSVTGINVTFNHEYLGDLQITATSPAGQTITLIGPIGFFGATDLTSWDVSFVASTATAMPDAGFSATWSNNQAWGLAGSYTGSYFPFMGNLEDFNTGPVDGTWIFNVTDDQGADVGNFIDFELIFASPVSSSTGTGSIGCSSNPPCSLTSIDVTIGACTDPGTIDPTDDTFVVTADIVVTDATSNDVTFDGALMTDNGGGNYTIVLPADGANNPAIFQIGDGSGTCTVDFADFASPAACSPAGCDADPGTFTDNLGASNLVCNLGDLTGVQEVILNTAGDYETAPADPCGILTPGSAPGVIYLLYSAPPTQADWTTDPNFITTLGTQPAGGSAGIIQNIEYGNGPISFGPTGGDPATNYNTTFYIGVGYLFEENDPNNLINAIDYDCGVPEALCGPVASLTAVTPFAVTEPIVISNVTTVCNADLTATVTFDVQGGVPAYEAATGMNPTGDNQFTLTNNGTGTLSTTTTGNATTVTINNVSAAYDIDITDANGCSQNLAGLWLMPTIDLNADATKVCEFGDDCSTANTVDITGTLTPQLGTFSFDWTTDAFPDESSWAITNSAGNTVASGSGYPGGAPINITDATSGIDPEETYFVTFFDSFGDGWSCADAGNLTIIDDGSGATVYTYPAGAWSSSGGCGITDNATFPNGNGSTFGPFPLGSPTAYVDPVGTITGTGVTDNGDNTATFNADVAGPGVHTVSYDYTSPAGCTLNETVDITVCANPATPVAAAGNPSDVCPGDPTALSVTDNSVAAPDTDPTTADIETYEWYGDNAGAPDLAGGILATGATYDPGNPFDYNNNNPESVILYVRAVTFADNGAVCYGCFTTVTLTKGLTCCDVAINTVDAVAETCDGENDGVITVNATSSNPPIMYSIDGGTTFQAGNSFTGLMPGSYDIVIQDTGGAACEAVATAVIADGILVDAPNSGGDVSIACGAAAPDISASPVVDCVCAFDDATMQISVSYTGNHTFISDLAFYLQAPDGTVQTLVSGVCCPNGGDDYAGVTFTNDPAAGNLDYSTAAAPLSGSYNSSDGVLIDFSVFNGQNIYAAGWNVIVGDCVGGDSGDLDRAVLTFTDISGTTCLGAGGSVSSDSGLADLNFPLNDGECAPGADNPALFAVAPISEIEWYDAPVGGNLVSDMSSFNVAGTTAEEGAFDNNTEGDYTYYAQANCNGCSSTSRTPVVVTVETCCDVAITSAVPVAEDCPGANDGTVTVTATSSNPPIMYSIDNGATFQATGDFTGLAPGTYDVVVQDAGGATCQAATTATVNAGVDNTPPTTLCQNITIQLDAAGNATITAAQIDNGSNDACGIQSLAVDPSAFTCANVGANTVTLTVTDVNGNVSTCDATVTVEDITPPTALCQDITIQLDAAGNATITAAQIDNGSNDACGIQSLAVDPSAFTCANVGANTVTLTVTDNNGLTSTCDATVTVEDTTPPMPECQDIVIQLDAAGNATITAAQIDNGSNDACGIQSLAVDPSAFTCANVGANTVTLTVTDNNGNIAACDATVTAEDTTPPTALCQDLTIQLDATGNANITAADIDNGSNDACGIQSLAVDPSAFVCANVGANTVTLTVTDNNGNVTTCEATVTVEDTTPPTAICQDITIQLDAAGNAGITAADIDNGSNDACGLQSLAVDPSAFTCANVGANTVTLTVTDNNDNVSTCDATVTVEDVTPPNAECQPFTVILDDAGSAEIIAQQVDNGSNDACGIASIVADLTDFTCDDTGAPNPVTLIVTDNNGLTAECIGMVSVIDNTPPDAQCQDLTVQLDPVTGEVSITPEEVDNMSFDICGIQSLALDNEDFTCADTGENTVTLTVTDNNNQVSTCTAVITVEDVTPPDAQCQDLVLQLDPVTGTVGITPADIDNGSSDICGIQSLTLDNENFSCADVGANTVTLTVTDNNDNVSTCTAEVTIQDVTAADCQTMDIEIFLDENGAVSIVPADIDDNSSDACGIASYVIDTESFDCTNLGLNTVELTLTDVNGNVSSCAAEVTVTDNIPAEITCRQPISTGNAPGECGNEITLLEPVVTDNCGGFVISSDAPADSYFDIGETVVTWSATDAGGNVTTCEQPVTVADTEMPVVSSCNTEIGFDYDGDCLAQILVTVTAVDNCGTVTIDGNGIFDTEVNGIFVHPVTITDASGNTYTHIITIYTHDEIPPVATFCPENLTVQEGSDLPNLIPAWADNCEIYSVESDMPDDFEVGTTQVTWTAEDIYGNTGVCSYNVTIEPQTIFIDAVAERIEASVAGTEETAEVRWNAPNVNTQCAYCPTTEYADYLYVGEFYGHQYFMYNGANAEMTRDAAITAGEADLNAHLVTVSNLHENNFIARNLPAGTESVRTGLAVATDTDGNFVFDWQNAELSTFDNLSEYAEELLAVGQTVSLNADGTWNLDPDAENAAWLFERPCIELRQIAPLKQITNAAGETEEVLLQSGDLWEIGEYTVVYEAENMCGDIFTRSFEVGVQLPEVENCATGGKDHGLFIRSVVMGSFYLLSDATDILSDPNAEIPTNYTDNTHPPLNAQELVTDELTGSALDYLPITLEPGGTHAEELIYWSIWADLNRDGDFFDADELVIQTTAKGETTVDLPLDIIPADVMHLRIMQSRYGYPEVCLDYYSGETEDYALFVPTPTRGTGGYHGSQPVMSEPVNLSAVVISPNPATDKLTFATPSYRFEGTINLTDENGRRIAQHVLPANTTVTHIDVSDLSNGFYFAEIIAGGESVRRKIVIIK